MYFTVIWNILCSMLLVPDSDPVLIPSRHCAIDLQGPDWSGVRSRITGRWFIWGNLSVTGEMKGGRYRRMKEDRVAEPLLHLIHKDIGCSHLLCWVIPAQ